ncbi:AAA family ATPase [Ancylobacter sonchi]|uniref:AAA family ATPase n=1 Tax=Ancylobacter sonchi TaxID=1937790 RepID=UPI001BD50D7C|nr:helicase RepA family protein [Ancylobacter sonchi]MBS7535039.1 AAA family ATPase [Ancylobacter sonchi]
MVRLNVLTSKSEPGEAFQPLKAANDNTAGKLKLVRALDFEEASIPVRQWIVPGLLIRRHLSVLVAPPGAGKSLLTLQAGLVMADGEPWGGLRPRGSYNVMWVNSEDDVDEMQRRLAAALRAMKLDRRALADRLFLAEDPSSIVVAQTDPKTKTVTRLPLADTLIATMKSNGIDVLVVDPFAETFEGDENSNSEVKWAAAIWRDVARQANAAVLLVHHVSKALSAAPGDMNAARGGSALVGVARTVVTLFSMSDVDAKVLGVPETERHMFVRFDDAKANLTLTTGAAKWFRKETIRLANGTPEQHGDDVGVLHPWVPPNAMDAITIPIANTILDELAKGLVDEDGKQTGSLYAYTDSKRGPRWAGHVVIRHTDVVPEQAASILKAWRSNGVIEEVEYHDDAERKPRKGVRVVEANRPGRAA